MSTIFDQNQCLIASNEQGVPDINIPDGAVRNDRQSHYFYPPISLMEKPLFFLQTMRNLYGAFIL